MMSTRISLGTLTIALLLILPACGDSDEAQITTEEQHIAQAYAELTFLSESARLGMLSDTTRTFDDQADSLLHTYGMDRETFDAEFRRFADDPERSPLLFKGAREHLQALRARRDSAAVDQ